jgi:hypothetical protein
MELLIMIVGLCLLAILALRFGSDSRPRAYSDEEHFARLGMTWDAAELHLLDLRHDAAQWRVAQQAAPHMAGRPGVWRRVTARTLRGVAAWLSPELARPPSTSSRATTGAR